MQRLRVVHNHGVKICSSCQDLKRVGGLVFCNVGVPVYGTLFQQLLVRRVKINMGLSMVGSSRKSAPAWDAMGYGVNEPTDAEPRAKRVYVGGS